jgi:class 3 adenylate cyclase
MWSAAMDVGAWLRSLGLGQYERSFRDNKIDADVLPQLTADDLKDMGVTAIGDRRRLLAAIAALPAATPREPAGDIEVKAQHAARAAPEASAERRQLSVMFCDLVGSTTLAARLDPEDMAAVIAAYHKAVADAVQGEDGLVAKYMGDGMLAYFGYPRAHEDDAERAVRAGLAIIEAAPMLKNAVGLPLQVRVGVATGIVVVGDPIGSGESRERGIVGDTPDLSARRQGIARPDSVVIAEATRRLIGDPFELEDLGEQELKGFAGPMRAFAARRARTVESRFEALREGGLTPLVGARRRSRFCCAAGQGPSAATEGSSSSPASRDREIEADGWASRALARGAAHPAAPFLLSPALRQRALSLHRAARARRRFRARG